MQSDRADSPAQNATVAIYDSYTQYDLRTGVDIDKFNVSVWVENLTNVQTLRSSNGGGIMGLRAIYGTPRTVGVNASYSFY
jgi:outer membrane receptor for ferric coprogen and ferric-rhodotorulic acid